MKTLLLTAASEGARRASMHGLLNTLNIRRKLPMNRVVKVIVSTGVMFVSTQAHAVDATNQSTTSKRQTIVQVIDCMRKRMSADKSRSYNEALKVCKDQISKERDDLPSGVLVASDTPAKP